MAINKELYERYKAMKAAKLAAQKEENSSQNQPVKSGFSALSQTSPVQNSENNNIQNQSSYIQEPTQAPVEYNKVNSYQQNNFQTSENTLSPTPELQQSSSMTPYSGNVAPSSGDINYTSQLSPSFSNNLYYEAQTNTQSSQNSHEIPAQNIQVPKPSIKKFALIGYPLGHSLSSYIHEAGFKSLGIQASYEIIETPPDELVDTVKYLKTHGYSGFNVTIPLKLPITMFMDEIDQSANIVNAINTVTINHETGILKGYNTDAIGFGAAIPQDIQLYNKTAGILGTGGAARAAVVALAHRGVREIRLYTRHIPNSIELLEFLRKSYPKITFESYQIDMIKDLSNIDILVNATPIGMQGHAAEFTPVEEKELQTLPKDAIVYDVIYNPKRTLFIRLAQKHNYRTITGMDMLVHQAVASEQIWTGRTPDFKDMKIAALENL